MGEREVIERSLLVNICLKTAWCAPGMYEMCKTLQ